jgi:hypothetical protein
VILDLLIYGTIGAAVGASVSLLAKNEQKRGQRRTDIHRRMETAWRNARIRMYLAGPIGPKHMPGTKYSKVPADTTNGSTNSESMRYIGG